MSKTMHDMIGARVQSVEKVFDYWQLHTDKGTINLNNPINYGTTGGVMSKLEETHIEDLADAIITNLNVIDECCVQIEFDRNTTLSMSLLDKDYTGPEAIEVYFNTGEMIVF